MAVVALFSQAKGIISVEYRPHKVGMEFLSKQVLDGAIPAGLSIKVDKAAKLFTFSGKKEDVEMMARRLKQLDAFPVSYVIDLDVTVGSQVVTTPKVRTLEGMAASISLPDCMEGGELITKIVPRPAKTGSIDAEVTLAYRDTVFTMPSRATADCSYAFETGTGKEVYVLFTTAGKTERVQVSSDWSVLAGRRLSIRLARL